MKKLLIFILLCVGTYSVAEEKKVFVYGKNGLQTITLLKHQNKGRMIDKLEVNKLIWPAHDNYAYSTSGTIFYTENIYNIFQIGRFGARTSCYPDCSTGTDPFPSGIYLKYFSLINDKISFMYEDDNNKKKNASIDVSDKNESNFITLT